MPWPAGRGGKGVAEAQAKALCEWAVGVRIDAGLLELALAGELDVTLPPGLTEPLFHEPGLGRLGGLRRRG